MTPLTLELTFIGLDSWSRPVYRGNSGLYVDVDPRRDRPPEICTKCNNDYEGEPDWSVPETTQIVFSPSRYTL
ncbi:MAG: hypothetical protein LBQ86_02700 [Holophagales bacterium]|nr:hypothetical protein [Holophagales bacterium]